MAKWSPKANEIFLASIEIAAPQERARYVEKSCAGDVELRCAVDELLSAAERAARSSFLESQASATLSAPNVAAAELFGTIIGNYKLLDRLGEGGFGVVYLAEQLQPVQRQVAIKIIKPGMDSRQVISRFETERQALALMDHPNIAKVFDAGAIPEVRNQEPAVGSQTPELTPGSGRPFFVMELVNGLPITKYADREQLSPQQRLELFIPVCQAVQHAHQKGVIHRDLKPSNVIIALYDGKPVPKVIDFGVAKAIGSKLGEETVHTDVGAIIGTLEYMSPEQAELNNLDIDTRADIYSLGVILYELLTGAPPFTAKQLRSAAFDEMLKMIREIEPMKPSTRLLERAANVSDRSLALAARQLLGELDWIVMKALEKDRARRYETANGMAMDLQRYLADEPVLAGPPSRLYRARKFLRRHKFGVASSVGISLLLIGGIVGTTLGLIEARTQRDEARRQQGLAENHYEQALAVSRFQADMLAAVDPAKLLGDKVTVLQAVTAAVTELDAGKLNDQPLVEANVRTVIGNSLNALGRYDLAEPNHRRSLELRRGALGAESELLAPSLRNLAKSLQNLGRLKEAESLFRESLEIYRKSVPEGEAAIPIASAHVSEVLKLQGKFMDAEKFAREALELQRRIQPVPDSTTDGILTNLGLVLRAQQKLDEAEPLLRESLAYRRRALPANHPDLPRAIGNLATLVADQEKPQEAEKLFYEVLAIQEKVLPVNHPDLSLTRFNIGIALLDQNKPADAEPLLRRALVDASSTLGENHQLAINARRNLGRALVDLRRFEEAETELLSAEKRQSAAPNAPKDRHVRCVRALVGLYEEWDKSEPGKGYDEEARKWRAKLPATQPATATQ